MRNSCCLAINILKFILLSENFTSISWHSLRTSSTYTSVLSTTNQYFLVTQSTKPILTNLVDAYMCDETLVETDSLLPLDNWIYGPSYMIVSLRYQIYLHDTWADTNGSELVTIDNHEVLINFNVGLTISCLVIPYVGVDKSYVGDIKSYAGGNTFYVWDIQVIRRTFFANWNRASLHCMTTNVNDSYCFWQWLYDNEVNQIV